jgi:hypothetical protein
MPLYWLTGLPCHPACCACCFFSDLYIQGGLLDSTISILARLSLQEGIGTIITAIIRSRKIFRRLETYVIYRMTGSIVILVRL